MWGRNGPWRPHPLLLVLKGSDPCFPPLPHGQRDSARTSLGPTHRSPRRSNAGIRDDFSPSRYCACSMPSGCLRWTMRNAAYPASQNGALASSCYRCNPSAFLLTRQTNSSLNPAFCFFQPQPGPLDWPTETRVLPPHDLVSGRRAKDQTKQLHALLGHTWKTRLQTYPLLVSLMKS